MWGTTIWACSWSELKINKQKKQRRHRQFGSESLRELSLEPNCWQTPTEFFTWVRSRPAGLRATVRWLLPTEAPFASLPLQPHRAEESQTWPKDPLGRSLPDAGLEQRPELREELQPLEPPLPQAAAQPHALRIQGPQTLQYPSSNRRRLGSISWFGSPFWQHVEQTGI